jgi:hypothetical protein
MQLLNTSHQQRTTDPRQPTQHCRVPATPLVLCLWAMLSQTLLLLLLLL